MGSLPEKLCKKWPTYTVKNRKTHEWVRVTRRKLRIQSQKRIPRLEFDFECRPATGHTHTANDAEKQTSASRHSVNFVYACRATRDNDRAEVHLKWTRVPKVDACLLKRARVPKVDVCLLQWTRVPKVDVRLLKWTCVP